MVWQIFGLIKQNPVFVLILLQWRRSLTLVSRQGLLAGTLVFVPSPNTHHHRPADRKAINSSVTAFPPWEHAPNKKTACFGRQESWDLHRLPPPGREILADFLDFLLVLQTSMSINRIPPCLAWISSFSWAVLECWASTCLTRGEHFTEFTVQWNLPYRLLSSLSHRG